MDNGQEDFSLIMKRNGKEKDSLLTSSMIKDLHNLNLTSLNGWTKKSMKTVKMLNFGILYGNLKNSIWSTSSQEMVTLLNSFTTITIEFG